MHKIYRYLFLMPLLLQAAALTATIAEVPRGSDQINPAVGACLDKNKCLIGVLGRDGPEIPGLRPVSDHCQNPRNSLLTKPLEAQILTRCTATERKIGLYCDQGRCHEICAQAPKEKEKAPWQEDLPMEAYASCFLENKNQANITNPSGYTKSACDMLENASPEVVEAWEELYNNVTNALEQKEAEKQANNDGPENNEEANDDDANESNNDDSDTSDDEPAPDSPDNEDQDQQDEEQADNDEEESDNEPDTEQDENEQEPEPNDDDENKDPDEYLEDNFKTIRPEDLPCDSYYITSHASHQNAKSYYCEEGTSWSESAKQCLPGLLQGPVFIPSRPIIFGGSSSGKHVLCAEGYQWDDLFEICAWIGDSSPVETLFLLNAYSNPPQPTGPSLFGDGN